MLNKIYKTRPSLYSYLQGWQLQYMSKGRRESKPIFDKRRAEDRNRHRTEMSKDFGRGQTFASLLDETECHGGQPAMDADRKLAEHFFSDAEVGFYEINESMPFEATPKCEKMIAIKL